MTTVTATKEENSFPPKLGRNGIGMHPFVRGTPQSEMQFIGFLFSGPLKDEGAKNRAAALQTACKERIIESPKVMLQAANSLVIAAAYAGPRVATTRLLVETALTHYSRLSPRELAANEGRRAEIRAYALHVLNYARERSTSINTSEKSAAEWLAVGRLAMRICRGPLAKTPVILPEPDKTPAAKLDLALLTTPLHMLGIASPNQLRGNWQKLGLQFIGDLTQQNREQILNAAQKAGIVVESHEIAQVESALQRHGLHLGFILSADERRAFARARALLVEG